MYCIWHGKSTNELLPKYIGHVSETISKQRMIAHLSKKNKATGSQLDKVTEAVKNDECIGITFVDIKPAYMRKALEDWLIEKHSKALEWNKQGRRKK